MPTREQLPGLLFAILPITLFFPIGITYVLVVFHLIACLAGGNIRGLWMGIRRNPVYTPNLILLAIVAFSAIVLSAANEHRWSGSIHYLVFVFLLLFASGATDSDYRRARLALFGGAVYAGFVYCLANMGALPDWVIFSYYNVYAGNKSISIGIFMAIAGAWMLNEAFNVTEQRRMWMLLAAFAFTAMVVVQFAVTRTGTLLVYLLSALVIARRLRFNLRSATLVGLALVVITVLAMSEGIGNRRLQGAVTAVEAAATAPDPSDVGTGESNRLQFLRVTVQMIAEKPLLGFGIGGWRQQYPVRAQGLETAFMSTPHNDYLLYGAETGISGLVALGLILAALLWQALRAKARDGTALLLVTSALIVGSLFNALLRDWRFGIPIMLLLAIALRESQNGGTRSLSATGDTDTGMVE